MNDLKDKIIKDETFIKLKNDIIEEILDHLDSYLTIKKDDIYHIIKDKTNSFQQIFINIFEEEIEKELEKKNIIRINTIYIKTKNFGSIYNLVKSFEELPKEEQSRILSFVAINNL